VVIPARNEEAYVAGALRSVAAQDWPASDLEAVVVVNGTTDATAEVVEEIAAAWVTPVVRLVVDPRPGVSRAKNLGARAARGEILVFLDADSRLAPNGVRQVVKAVEAGYPAGTIRVVADSDDLLDRAFFGLIEWGKNLLGIYANMLFCRREEFLAAGGFDERLHHAEDLEFLVRLARRGVPLIHLRETWIATSPRRLHQGPLRIGLVKVFARWTLGHLGFWRERPY
jgi:glycosyltransferase involved in cell wall biosynthesis